MTYWLRLWCLWRHKGEHLSPALVGGLRCRKCGVGYESKVDAGLMEEMSVQVPRPWIGTIGQETFGVQEYRVLSKGKVQKVVQFRRGETKVVG